MPLKLVASRLMEDKKGQCPMKFLWRSENSLSNFISVFLGLALLGVLLKSIFWTISMSFFAIKWVFVVALGWFIWHKVKNMIGAQKRTRTSTK